MRQRASLPGAAGAWAQSIDALNTLVNDMVQPTTEVARVIGAVAKGDLSQTMALEIEGRPLTGEFLRTAKVVNTMVDQLGTFASEVTRVAREVGTDGKLGGQAVVKGVGATWKDLTDSVNFMAANLTGQVRNIAEVTTAVASGDLSRKITVDVKGEILQLKNTINTMVDQLSSFASEVTRVAARSARKGAWAARRRVEGVAGVWKNVTDNVNTLAGNLTVQLRDVSKVATAIAQGDSQKITVDVRGEVLRIRERRQHDARPAQTRLRRRSRGSPARSAPTASSVGRRSSTGIGRHVEGPHRQRQLHGQQPDEPGPRHRRVVTDVANGHLQRKLVLEARGRSRARRHDQRHD